MTKADLVEAVARATDLSKKQSETIVDTMLSKLTESLQKSQGVELRGFGSFRIRKRGSRQGRNPKTGKSVQVPAKRVVYFKMGKELKDLINRPMEDEDSTPMPPAED
jgi:integration host factor subunit beta